MSKHLRMESKHRRDEVDTHKHRFDVNYGQELSYLLATRGLAHGRSFWRGWVWFGHGSGRQYHFGLLRCCEG